MFEYPKQAAVNRAVPKSKIYANGKVSRATRERFVTQVAEIVWKYKLAASTVNLAAAGGVEEIQVFEVVTKAGELGEDVLRAMDQAIPSRLFFEIVDGEQVKFAAAYKRTSEAAAGARVVAMYFETPWQEATRLREALPVALDLAGLYERILLAHIERGPLGLRPRAGETLGELVERAGLIQAKARECRQWEARMEREIQFNRKVEWNAAFRECRGALKALQQQ